MPFLSSRITFGGSYPGSLSGWMRLKFPNLIQGSVASSGPVLAQLDFQEYLQVETRTIRDYRMSTISKTALI